MSFSMPGDMQTKDKGSGFTWQCRVSPLKNDLHTALNCLQDPKCLKTSIFSVNLQITCSSLDLDSSQSQLSGS